MYKTSLIKLGIALGVVFAAINTGQAQSSLRAGEWRLKEINGRAVANSQAVLTIDPARNTVSGNAGCNRVSGQVSIIGTAIRFGTLRTTKMYCADRQANRVETELLRVLPRVDRFRSSGSTLSLVAGKRIVAKFAGVSDPAKRSVLEGKWLLERIGGKNVDGPNNSAFINFNAEKRSAGGNTGCNVFGGNFFSKGAQLSIRDVISTMRACIEDDRMQIERDFLDALRQTDRYSIEAGRLTLYQGKTPLLRFRKES